MCEVKLTCKKEGKHMDIYVRACSNHYIKEFSLELAGLSPQHFSRHTLLPPPAA